MYKSFRVKNFRCFKDLQINDLGRVNLIAGKNNTGKTALMEAMYIFTKPLTPGVLYQLQEARGLDIPSDELPAHWKQFFYRLDSSLRIAIRSIDVKSNSCQELTITEHDSTRQNFHLLENLRMDLLKYGVAGTDSRAVVGTIDRFLEFELRSNEEESESVWFFASPWIYRNRDAEQLSYFIPVQGRPGVQQVSNQFSQLEIDGTVPVLIEVLRIFAPEIDDLRLLSPDGNLVIWADLNGIRLPLRAMGEGMNVISNFAITMLTNPACVIFIDEIENGIHHSVQCKVWQAIGKLARELDIQVFATTHSLEMIRSAYEAFKDDDPYEFRYHRLDRKTDGNIEAVTYNKFGMDAVAAFDFEYEVRG